MIWNDKVKSFSTLAHWEEMEIIVKQWFDDRRSKGFPVSTRDIQLKARRTFDRWWGNLTDDEPEHYRRQRPEKFLFHASKGWLRRFMLR